MRDYSEINPKRERIFHLLESGETVDINKFIRYLNYIFFPKKSNQHIIKRCI